MDNKMSSNINIALNLKHIRKEVTEAKKFTKNKTKSVKLVAVSKTINEGMIIEAIKSGHLCFGENKVQEAIKKWPRIKIAYPNTKLHMIGALQSNKIKDALNIFDVIETIDREKIAIAISKNIKNLNKKPELYVQINIGEEPQKSGCLPQHAVNFIKECNLLGLNVTGVMGIAPVNAPPAPYFALLTNIANKLSIKNISMGMSNDFKDAIYLGATSVRIGSKIFGERMLLK